MAVTDPIVRNHCIPKKKLKYFELQQKFLFMFFTSVRVAEKWLFLVVVRIAINLWESLTPDGICAPYADFNDYLELDINTYVMLSRKASC